MVAIIMATYNGESFLREQLDSILNSTYDSFHLYIYDDNSTDNTAVIITEYATKFPQIIFPTLYNTSAGNACTSFFRAIAGTPNNYNYYMLADQDDIWHKDKIATTLAIMKKAKYHQKIYPFWCTRIYVWWMQI